VVVPASLRDPGQNAAVLVEISVLVPGDRVKDFQTAHGSFAAGHPMSDPLPGSNASSWQAVTVQITDGTVAAFYEAFARWLTNATTPAIAPPEMSADELKTAFPLLPRMEKELLRLLADDSGRVIGWAELKSKFCLAGKPSASHALPHLAARCTALKRGMPIQQEDSGDDTVFSLPLSLVAVVSKL
jgi:hypothetical protein